LVIAVTIEQKTGLFKPKPLKQKEKAGSLGAGPSLVA
jgi:hypothetical protein